MTGFRPFDKGDSGGSVSTPRADRLSGEDLLRAVVDSAVSAVVTMDEDGSISGWGARAQDTFGWSRDEVLGRQLAEVIVPPQYREAHNAGLARFRRTRRGPVLGSVLELSALRRDGTEFPVELRIASAAEVDGEAVFIAFVFDITERIEASRKLERALKELGESYTAMDDFVHMVVHELRQPLNVARGYLDLYVEDAQASGAMGDEQRWLQTADEKLQEALALVADVLLSARLSGRTTLTEVADFDLVVAVHDAAARVRPAVELRHGSLEVSTPDGPVMARADPVATARILDNLVNNAVLYSPQAPQLTITCDAGGTVTVADRGEGVPEAMSERIFERFVRVDSANSSSGTGLGLYISRQLAVQQGGALNLISTGPNGSMFALRVPLAG